MSRPRVAVLMPVFDDHGALARTLRDVDQASRAGPEVTVFLVDDGSDPAVAAEDVARAAGRLRVVLARHAVNLGQGAALETARRLALRAPGFAAYVTMDADGQHGAADALALADAVMAGADVAFGNRFLGDSNVPAFRAVVLRAARVFEWALTGLRLADAHNGLRAFRRDALERIAIRQNRMAHATEIKQRVSRIGTLTVVEAPVSVRYTPATLARGQSAFGALAIVRDLALRYLFGDGDS